MKKRIGNKSFIIVILTLFSLNLGVSVADAQDINDENIEGEWIGTYTMYDNLWEFGTEFQKIDGNWTGTTQVPIGPTEERPLTFVEVDGRSIKFRDQRVSAFKGSLEDGVISGELKLDKYIFDIRFVRKGSDEAKIFREKLGKSSRSSIPDALELVEQGKAYNKTNHEVLERFIEAADTSNSSAVAVMHKGELVGTWYSGGKEKPLDIMSVTKPIVGLAVGRLIYEGKIESVDTPVHEFLPEWSSGDYANITIRHLMTHTSGLSSGQPLDFTDDGVSFALESELVTKPGNKFRYNNNAINLLVEIVKRAAEQPINEYMTNTIFKSMDIDNFTWEGDRAGNLFGMKGVSITAKDLAKIGQLVLQHGKWNGEQLIDSTWIRRSVSPQLENPPTIGLLWMVLRKDEDNIGYWHSGSLGQYLVIYPEEQLVGVRQIVPFPSYNMETDGFRTFMSMVRKLGN